MSNKSTGPNNSTTGYLTSIAPVSTELDVTYAALQGGPIFIPGVGQYGPTLVVGSGSTVSRITKMTLGETTLTVDIDKVRVLIPLTNVTHMRVK